MYNYLPQKFIHIIIYKSGKLVVNIYLLLFCSFLCCTCLEVISPTAIVIIDQFPTLVFRHFVNKAYELIHLAFTNKQIY